MECIQQQNKHFGHWLSNKNVKAGADLKVKKNAELVHFVGNNK